MRYSGGPRNEKTGVSTTDLGFNRSNRGRVVPPVRRESSPAFRRSRPGVWRKGISEQDQPSLEQRRRCRAAAKTYTGILRLLRLAFVSPRTLVAGALGENFPRRPVCEASPGSAPQKSQRGKPKTGSRLFTRRRPGQFRAALWNGVVAATRRRIIRVG